MEVMAIDVGSIVEARTASGELVSMRAMGAPTRGRDFPVLWVCTQEEWERAQASGTAPDGLPWPLDAVKVPQSI